MSEKVVRVGVRVFVIASLSEKYDVWKARIDLAKKARKTLLDQGDKNVDFYEGKIITSSETGFTDNIAVNLVYVDVKQSIHELYAKNPHFFFDPLTPEAEKSANVLELMVNVKWSDLKMKNLVRDVIKSAKLYGVCGFKTYFNFKKEFVKNEWTDRIQNDEVRTDRVPLKCLLKDPSSTWTTSPWIIHEIEAPVDDIAEMFNIRRRKDIAVTRSTQGSSDFESEVKTDFQFGRYYEIEDRKKGEVSVVVDGIDKFVKKPEEKKYPYDTMYDFLQYNDLPDRPDTLSDFAFWRDQLKEVARFRTMQLNHARKGTAKYKWRGAPPTEDQKTQLASSRDSSVIELGVDQDVEPFVHSGIDPQTFAAEQIVRQDIQIISKQAPRQTSGKKTATEVQAVEAAAKEVSSESLERLEEALESIAGKWAALMQENYSATKVVSLTEMSDAEFLGYRNDIGDKMLKGSAKRPFLEVTKGALKGKIRSRIQAGSSAPDNEQVRLQKFQGFLSFVGSNQAFLQAVDIEELIKEATELFDVKNDNLLAKKNDPYEETKLLNRGVFLMPKMNEDHDKHLEVHKVEGTNNTQNILHRLAHEEFKRQLEESSKIDQKLAVEKLQKAQSGQSFVGSEAPLGAPSPLPAQPQSLPNGVGPTGGGLT